MIQDGRYEEDLVRAALAQAAQEDALHVLPAPEIIWRKHELRSLRASADRCLKPIERWEQIGVPTAMVVLLALGIIVFAATIPHGSSRVLTSILVLAVLAVGTVSGVLFRMLAGRRPFDSAAGV